MRKKAAFGGCCERKVRGIRDWTRSRVQSRGPNKAAFPFGSFGSRPLGWHSVMDGSSHIRMRTCKCPGYPNSWVAETCALNAPAQRSIMGGSAASLTGAYSFSKAGANVTIIKRLLHHFADRM